MAQLVPMPNFITTRQCEQKNYSKKIAGGGKRKTKSRKKFKQQKLNEKYQLCSIRARV